ncbi:MAG: ZIP family metal transporter [Bacillota bacterium]
MWYILIVSLLAGLATGLGAVPLLIFKDIPHKLYDGLLGFAAGIMVAASSLTLIPEALGSGSIPSVLLGLAAGAGFILALETGIPHLEPHFSVRPLSLNLRQGVLLGLAIAIHNFPEGFAVGVGYSSGVPALGPALALAIAAQNIPEGLAVALPFRKEGVPWMRCILYATASGLTEPIAAVLGVYFMRLADSVLPFGLAFAAGAMIYVASDELIPESHKHGNEAIATYGVVIGFALMIVMNAAL